MWHLISLDYFLCSIKFIYYAFRLKLGFLIWKFHLRIIRLIELELWILIYQYFVFMYFITFDYALLNFMTNTILICTCIIHFSCLLKIENLLLVWTLPCKILEIHENYLEIAYTTTCPLRMIDKRRQLNKYFIWNNILDLRTLIFMLIPDIKCKQWFSLLSSFNIHAL